MDNIDVLIYAKGLIQDLENSNFFITSENAMMEKDVFEKYLMEFCHQNVKDIGDPTIDEDQLLEIINLTTTEVIKVTLNSLYDKGLIEIVGIDDKGFCAYKSTEKGLEVINNINKKKI